MKPFFDHFFATILIAAIALTGAHCKKDKDEVPPPQDRWEHIVSARQKELGIANWSFIINDKVYFGGRNNDVYIYDLTKKDWIGSFNYPPAFEARWNCAVAVHNNKAYIGNGRYGAGMFLQDWWEFDPASGTPWKQLTNCPIAGADGRAFVLGNTLYNTMHIDDGTGNQTIQTHVYTYDIAKDSWDANFSQLGKNCGTSGFGFVLDSKFYYGTGYNNSIPGSIFTKECAVFNPANRQTTPLAAFPVEMTTSENARTFTHNGKGYVLGSNHELFELDPVSNKWSEMNKVPENQSHGRIMYVHQYQNKVYGFTTKGQLYEHFFQ